MTTVPLKPGKTCILTSDRYVPAAASIVCTAWPMEAPGIASVNAKMAPATSMSCTNPFWNAQKNGLDLQQQALSCVHCVLVAHAAVCALTIASCAQSSFALALRRVAAAQLMTTSRQLALLMGAN